MCLALFYQVFVFVSDHISVLYSMVCFHLNTSTASIFMSPTLDFFACSLIFECSSLVKRKSSFNSLVQLFKHHTAKSQNLPKGSYCRNPLLTQCSDSLCGLKDISQPYTSSSETDSVFVLQGFENRSELEHSYEMCKH